MKDANKREETRIQNAIEAAFGAEPDLLILRNSIGKAKYAKPDGGHYFVPYGLGTGSPDLVCMLRAPGRLMAFWLCWEVKVPGEEAEPEQAKCHAQWRAMGALVFVVHSVAEARASLAAARHTALHVTQKDTP